MTGSGVGAIALVRAVVVMLAATTTALSCAASHEDEAEGVMPLHTGSTSSTTEPAPTPSGPPATDAPWTPATDDLQRGSDAGVPATDVQLAQLRAELDQALLVYDRALTALVGRPTAAADPADPLRTAWDLAVGPSTAFSSEMLAAIRQRFELDRIVIRPDPTGLAYRHHTLVVTEPSADTVSFTWCGHSPGIGIDADSGEIVDDGVGHARGTGMASRFEDRWRIDSLDEFELTVLAPGSPDPCPSEAARAEPHR